VDDSERLAGLEGIERVMPLSPPLLLGTIQGGAVMPGISRSGSTVAPGILTGIRHQAGARFSLPLPIPAIIGAARLVLTDALAPGGAA
jgi:undecaprenyl-diphosphatase